MKKTFICFLIITNCFFFAMSHAQTYKTHRVESGETIAEIAKKYEVSEAAIYKLNPDAKKGKLTAMMLVIPPGETPDGITGSKQVRFKEYKVKKKETLYGIAKEHNVEVKDLKKYNDYLYERELGVGDTLRVPIFNKKSGVDYNQSLKNSSFKNLTHIVLPKEGKYRIAKNYGMTLEEFEKLNPNVSELQPGQIVKVSSSKQREGKDNQYRYYTVKPKETLYSLTKRFSISEEELTKLNPDLASEGLESGMELKLPKKQETKTAESEIDTLFGNVGKRLVLEKYINNKYKNQRIAIMLPFNLQKFEGDSIDKPKIIKGDRVLRISLDFYSGVTAAIDSVEKLGISVNAHVFDTQQNLAQVKKVLQENDFSNYQAVIGPLLTTNIEETARALQKENTPVFSPLTGNEISGLENVFQARPSDLKMEEALVTYIDSLKEDKNVLILSDKKHTNLKNRLASVLPSAKIVHQEKPEYLQKKDIEKLLNKETENWIIIEADELALISNATSYLNALSKSYNIRLFTSDKSEPYDEEISNEYLSKLHFTFASIAKEYDVVASNQFIKDYLDKYGITPSKYAVRGFDLTYDILLRLASKKNMYKSLKDFEGTTEYIENKFDYREKMTGGYYNNAVYLIEYSEGLELNVLN